MLAQYDILDFTDWILLLGGVIVSCLVTTCMYYLAIRKRLKYRVPAIDGTYNRQNEPQQNLKLSRTLFIAITASLLFWVSSLVVYLTSVLYSKSVPLLRVVQGGSLARFTNGKNRGSRITDIKISFSRITKTSK